MENKSFCKKIIICLIFVCFITSLFSQNKSTLESQTIVYSEEQQKIRVSANSVKLIIDKENGGYHLYVKKSENVNSILRTP